VAAELLAARADAPAVAERHARHYTAMAGGTDWPVAGQARWAQRLGRDQENIRTAIEWSFGHDIGPLPHVFRILWLYWQITDRMPEGRAWVTQLEGRIDALDEAGRAELVFTAGVTAVEVGDDAAGLAAIEPLDALVADIDDPYLVSAAQLARSWILPIHDDLDAALAAAAAALDGFRRQGVPFLAFAGLTVGMLELRLGDPASARTHLEEVHALGQQYGNQWLESAAQTQLATLAIAEGRFDVARRLLAGSVAGSDDVDLSTLIATFALVARAELALAEGDAEAAATALGAVDGLRARSGLRPWPLTRRSEAALAARVASALEPDVDAAARSAGAALTRRSSIDLVRH
jgi:ATP/maltotriose-dependent transcriptional regulator MalT